MQAVTCPDPRVTRVGARRVVIREPGIGRGDMEQVKELWRHQAGNLLWSASVAPRGDHVAFGSWDTHAYLFGRDGNLLWKRATGDFACVAFADGGDRLIIGSYDKQVRCFDAAGKEHWTAPVGGFIRGVASSAAGVAVVEWEGKLRQLGPNGQKGWEKDLGTNALTVDSSRDGALTVVGLNDKRVIAFGPKGEQRWTATLGGPASRLAVSADGSVVAAGSSDTSVNLYDAEGNLLWSHRTGGTVRGLCLSADGDHVAVAFHLHFLSLLDRKGQVVWVTRAPKEVWSLGGSDLLDTLVVGTRDGIGLVYDNAKVLEGRLTSIAKQMERLGGGQEIEPVKTLLKDGKSALTAGDRGHAADAILKAAQIVRTHDDLQTRKKADAALAQLETTIKGVTASDPTLLVLMRDRAKELLGKGHVERAERLALRAVGLAASLPPPLPDEPPEPSVPGAKPAGGPRPAEGLAKQVDEQLEIAGTLVTMYRQQGGTAVDPEDFLNQAKGALKDGDAEMANQLAEEACVSATNGLGDLLVQALRSSAAQGPKAEEIAGFITAARDSAATRDFAASRDFLAEAKVALSEFNDAGKKAVPATGGPAKGADEKAKAGKKADRCPSCGKKVRPDWTDCPFCQTKLR